MGNPAEDRRLGQGPAILVYSGNARQCFKDFANINSFNPFISSIR